MISVLQRHRHSIRLKGYDYAGGGVYFVTVCTKNKEYLFGEVVDGEMRLNECGKVVEEEWLRTAKLRSNVQLDRYIVMPNHFHGIIMIHDRVGAPRCGAHYPPGRAPYHGAPVCVRCRDMARHVPTEERKFGIPIAHSLSSIIGSFKSAVTRRIHSLGFVDFLWQPRFYDHIIRNEEERIRIREYIVNNSLRWDLDRNCDDVFPW